MDEMAYSSQIPNPIRIRLESKTKIVLLVGLGIASGSREGNGPTCSILLDDAGDLFGTKRL